MPPDRLCIIRSMSKAIELEEQRLRLPLDRYQRYKAVSNVPERLRENSGSLRALETGEAEGVIPKRPVAGGL